MQVPSDDDAVLVAGKEDLTRVGECERFDPDVRLALEGVEVDVGRLAGPEVEHPADPVLAPGRDGVAVRVPLEEYKGQ